MPDDKLAAKGKIKWQGAGCAAIISPNNGKRRKRQNSDKRGERLLPITVLLGETKLTQ